MAAATFITKLTKECKNYESITDRNTTRSVRFKDEPNASHQTLGPLFKSTVPEAINHLLQDHCLRPLFQGYDWPRWEPARPQGVWPSTTADWSAWVARLEPFFGNDWRSLGIYDAIKISAIEIQLD